MRALVFDTPVGLDRESREYVPRVARSWSWNDDNTELILDLRDDVTFHAGRSFGPDDVRFALETAADPDTGSQVGEIARFIESIEQTGDFQVAATGARSGRWPAPNARSVPTRTRRCDPGSSGIPWPAISPILRPPILRPPRRARPATIRK